MTITLIQPGLLVLVILVYFVLAVIFIFITRAIFSIGTIVKNLKAQTKLLALIASKNLENVDQIDGILNDNVRGQ